MSYELPTSTDYTIQYGDTGMKAWAVQKALEERGYNISLDGVYKVQTRDTVEAFQRANDLSPVDGKFGPATSAKMAARLEPMVPGSIPAGLIRGFSKGESGDLIAAVNWTVSGGVDCGYVQRRLYDADFDNLDAKKRAFDSLYQFKLLGQSLVSWHDKYWSDDNAVNTHEWAWRLAALRHNYPYGADKIAAVGISGLSSYWTSYQQWVADIGAKFPDGTPITWPLSWCKHYALSAPEHNDPGLVTKYVNDWS